MVLRKKTTCILLISLVLILAGCSKSEQGFDALKIRKEVQNLDPNDPKTKSIQCGRELFNETHSILPEHVGNNLSCISCHGEGGMGPDSPMVGVTALYPKEHHGKWTTIEDRINGCFIRSMNGKEIDEDGKEMKAMVAYLEFISKDVKSEDDITWRMVNNKDSVPEPDVVAGAELYNNKSCITCHAADGSGTGERTGPALWGDGSFNEAAGLNRLNKATAFIQNNMPKNDPGTLTDQEAADLAAFILLQDRPEGDPEKLGDFHKDPKLDYLFKDRREKLKSGELKWTDLDVVDPK